MTDEGVGETAVRPLPQSLAIVLLCQIVLTACQPAPAGVPAPTQSPSAQPTEITREVLTPTLAPTLTETPAAPTPTPTPNPVLAMAISYIRMMDASNGWAKGQVGLIEPWHGSTHILRTTNGGRTWRDASPPRQEEYGLPAFFLDAQQAWAWDREGHVLWRTRDGGQSWTRVEGGVWGDAVWFNDDQHGWRFGGEAYGMSFPGYNINYFETTQDGGRTWNEMAPPPGQGGWPFPAFPDDLTAWMVRAGHRAATEGQANLSVPIGVYTTFDGGSTWLSRMLPLPAEAFTVDIQHEGIFLGGVGNCDFASPVYSSIAIWKLALTCEDQNWMYTTANQGKTWIISPMPAGLDAAIRFISPTIGWSFHPDPLDYYGGGLHQTSNGGQSWNLLAAIDYRISQLDFLDAHTGWAVAELPCTSDDCPGHSTEVLGTTSDGGRTWQILNPQLEP